MRFLHERGRSHRVGTSSVPVVPGGLARARRGSPKRERPPAGTSRTAGYFFVALYFGLLLLLGIAPVVYAIISRSPVALVLRMGSDRTSYPPSPTTASHRRSSTSPSSSVCGWSVTILVVALTLILHNLAVRVGSLFRFLFYIPGALAGAASVVVWLFMLDPTASPFAFILHWLGYAQFDNTIAACRTYPQSLQSWPFGPVPADGSW